MSTTVIRVEKNREFVVMSNKFLREKEMSLKAKGLLALCLSLPDTWNYSLNGLCAICKESLTAIRSTLKELEQFGYLKRNKLKNDKGQFIYEYIICEQPYAQNLHLGEQHVEKQEIADVYAENNREEKIKEENKEKENIEEINLYIEQHAFAATWSLLHEYLEIRKEIGAPLSMRGLKMLLTRLEKLSNGNVGIQRLMLENAIMNKWKNIYKPKQQEIEANNEAQTNELKNFYGLQ